jgi:hypothetical protein
MKCSCGFIFTIYGFRNCETFADKNGNWNIICPDCKKVYKIKEEKYEQA